MAEKKMKDNSGKRERTALNRSKRILKHKKECAPKVHNVPRGTKRAQRRKSCLQMNGQIRPDIWKVYCSQEHRM